MNGYTVKDASITFTLKDAKRQMIKQGVRKRDAMSKMAHMTDVERINYLVGIAKEKKKKRGPIPYRGINSCSGRCNGCIDDIECDFNKEYFVRWI